MPAWSTGSTDLVASTTSLNPDASVPLYDSRAFLTMLDQLSANEFGIGFVYSVLTLLAQHYQLSDAVVVVGDESLGTQAFRLDRKNVGNDSTATVPGVFSAPDVVPDVVKDVVRSVCQLALSLHVARHGAAHDRLTNTANRRYFDSALRTAAVQSARYGWRFTLVLAEVNGYETIREQVGQSVSDNLLRTFGYALRQSVRSGDTAARIGDEEFGVILWNAERAEVSAFTDRLRALSVPGTDQIDFTIGTATSPRDSTDPIELHRIAAARLGEKKSAPPQ
jgi:diguanylate cyclase (GGDEF)-like protein